MDDKAQIFAAPVAKAAVALGSATAVNADRIFDAASGAAYAASPLLQLTWPNLAAAAATLFSLCMLFDWWWKRLWRPLLERLGWLKPKTGAPADSRWSPLGKRAANDEGDST